MARGWLKLVCTMAVPLAVCLRHQNEARAECIRVTEMLVESMTADADCYPDGDGYGDDENVGRSIYESIKQNKKKAKRNTKVKEGD